MMTSFKFKNNNLLFMNCHLPHGASNIKSRVKTLNKIMRKIL